MNDFITNIKDFPDAVFFPKASEKYRDTNFFLIKQLIENGSRPTPERIEALSAASCKILTRKLLDEVFSSTESLSLPETPDQANFDPGYPRLSYPEISAQLTRNIENKRWLQHVFGRVSQQYNISLNKDMIHAGNQLLAFLSTNVSYWEADSFPLDAMMDLQNRYKWTFQSTAWSLRELLRREADVIYKGWIELLELARTAPLFVILNQCTPTDYFCSFLPKGVSLYQENNLCPERRILLYTNLKISSSEHRILLENTVEGKGLEKAVQIATDLGRLPVLCDFSRRRFPRSIMRAARFAAHKGWAVRPLGKLFDPKTSAIPEAKSPRGFTRTPGNPLLVLFDPWPISDEQIVPQLPPEMSKFFNLQLQTKPWQDDRIGARSELEMDHTGMYQRVSESWIVPALGGWMRVDHVFQSRLSRFLSRRDYENLT
ncbi:hypothetical protein JWG39_00470 [Desulforhopalus vacuolatus]|uniref:hypothetical protein n=1 Tax=Desulforhopalus vacuolatus TaxID=40414 RepID=UPI001966082F|nr:hypothetical protein [Desulforhopalus vacuolatus]MBM9518288.1 hypothetical protein [Desulforhopalus vacuolatus]